MKRPYIKSLGTKISPLITSFSGLDTSRDPLRVQKGRASYMTNISAVSSPAVKPREGRTLITALNDKVLFFGVIKGLYLTVVLKKTDGCYWKYYDGVWKDICKVDESPTGKYDMLTFLNETILVTGKIYTVSGIEKTKHYYICFDESGNMTYGRKTVMPVADMAETVNGRIAVSYTKNDKLYLGGIMDSSVWFEIDDGLSQSVITQNGEYCTALKTYNGHLIYFKPHSFGEIYGNTPDTYQMIMVSESIGCLSDKSCVDCGRLIWLCDNGILSYSGGALPSDLTAGLRGIMARLDRERAKEAAAGSDKRRYIVCLPVDENSYINCVLNLETGEWYIEDTKQFLFFANMDGNLYGADSEGNIFMLWDDSSEENSVFEWRTNVYEANTVSKVNLNRLHILCDIKEGGFVNAAIVNDIGEENEETIAFSACQKAGRQRLLLHLHPRFFHGRNTYKIIISGQRATVHSICSEGRSIEKAD